MKILYHHRTQAEDAQGVHIAEIINSFRKLGNQVELVSLVKDSEGGSTIESAPSKSLLGRLRSLVPPFAYELMGLFYNIWGYVTLRKAIKHTDFIYERYSLFMFCGVMISKVYKIPLILEVNSPIADEQLKYDKLVFAQLALKMESWICSSATYTIAVSTPLKKILISKGVPPEKIVVMSNGINPDNFPSSMNGEAIRKKLGFSDGDIVLGFVGWFRKWHGLDTLIEAYHKNGWSDTCRVMFIGEGPEMENLQLLTEKYSLQKSIIFTGAVPREKIAEYIFAFDIALQPKATPYASPMKIFEYLAMGKPVIGPRQENISEILTDGVDSLLFTPDDPGSLAEVLGRLLSDSALYKHLKDGALQTVKRRNYYWDENAGKVLGLVSDIRS